MSIDSNKLVIPWGYYIYVNFMILLISENGNEVIIDENNKVC